MCAGIRPVLPSQRVKKEIYWSGPDSCLKVYFFEVLFLMHESKTNVSTIVVRIFLVFYRVSKKNVIFSVNWIEERIYFGTPCIPTTSWDMLGSKYLFLNLEESALKKIHNDFTIIDSTSGHTFQALMSLVSHSSSWSCVTP